MEIHLGVIRDRQGIYSALLQSKTLNRQLAICFSSEGKLLVKICTVVEIDGSEEAAIITVRSQPSATGGDTTIVLDHIQSIYPICDFI